VTRREAPLLSALVALVALVSVLQPRFFSLDSLRSVLLWVPLLTVVAMGQMAVILTRGVDVSVGSILGLSGMSVAVLLRDHPGLNLYGAALLSTGVGAFLGAINGGLISLGRVPAIVATLGTMGIFRGLTFVVSQGRQVSEYELPRPLAAWSNEGPLGQSLVPWVVLLALVAAVAMHVFLTRTRGGRTLYALGGNPDAAVWRGLPTRAATFWSYVLCGAGAGLAGVLWASRYGTVNPASIGLGFELLVIASVVIGGVSVFGGSGSVPGVVLGCLLLGTINVALSVLSIDATWQQAVYGLVILLAILFDDVAMRRLRLRLTGEA
jgi:rhamnose transport system permease protein